MITERACRLLVAASLRHHYPISCSRLLRLADGEALSSDMLAGPCGYIHHAIDGAISRSAIRLLALGTLRDVVLGRFESADRAADWLGRIYPQAAAWGALGAAYVVLPLVDKDSHWPAVAIIESQRRIRLGIRRVPMLLQTGYADSLRLGNMLAAKRETHQVDAAFAAAWAARASVHLDVDDAVNAARAAQSALDRPDAAAVILRAFADALLSLPNWILRGDP